MPITGYETTLAGATLGAITGIKSVRVGGVEVSMIEVAALGDTNRIPENVPGKVRESPVEVTIIHDKTLYDTMRDAAIARTEDTFTLTDAETSTHVGLGFVSKVGEEGLDTEGDVVFTAVLTPKTSWAFTAGA